MAGNPREHRPCDVKTPVNAMVYGKHYKNPPISTGFSTDVENLACRGVPFAESWRIYHSTFDVTIIVQIGDRSSIDGLVEVGYDPRFAVCRQECPRP
jgi:hypothetical protein